MRLTRLLAIAIAVALLLEVGVSQASAATAPRLFWVKCQSACMSGGKVQRGGLVRLAGRNFTAGSRVVFSIGGGSTRRVRV
jgi:hypothetical protein